MKYNIQNPKGEWLTGYNWDGDDWVTSWNRVRAKLLSRSDINMIKDALVDGCKHREVNYDRTYVI